MCVKQVAAAVEVVASAIEEEASADDDTWPQDESSTCTPLITRSTAGTPGEVPASSAVSETFTGDGRHKQSRKSNGSSKRRGTSFSGMSALAADQSEDQSTSYGGTATPDSDRQKSSGKKQTSRDERSKGALKSEKRSASLLFSLRTLWTRRKWEAGCKGLP